MAKLTFLKLGGSLITDKRQASTARHEVIARLAAEISEARRERGDLPLLLGHGSGSFGHFVAKQHGTREGVSGAEQWTGFLEVWQAARELHNLVIEALQEQGLPVIGFAPSASAISWDGQVAAWNTSPIEAALETGLIPVVYGDVVFDQTRGGGILSTEELFLYLAQKLEPGKVLLAANDPVYSDFPQRNEILPEINTANLDQVRQTLSGGEGSDVTGGMLSKVEAALEMATSGQGGVEVWIFSAERQGQIKKALLSQPEGTRIRA